MWKKIVLTVVILITLFVFFNWEIVSYGLSQARGQLKIIREAKPIEEVLTDTSVPDSIKNKIRLIQDVRSYAISEIGLEESKNYTSYYDQKGQVMLWNLSACEPYEFTPKLWSFPFLGSFPYKGYFDLDKAKEEYQLLKEQGYDASIRPVNGWSTLGWTKDPILSNMTERSAGAIVELIIHELTHSTLFVKDNIEFNENLASFIGERGAIQYLTETYGKRSEELIGYILDEEDTKTFRNQMLLATTQLDSLYGTFSEDTPDSIKYFQKHLLIDQITSSLDTLHFHDSRYYQVFSKAQPNNAYFMSYRRYYSSEDSLTQILLGEYQNDLRTFVRGMKEYHEN